MTFAEGIQYVRGEKERRVFCPQTNNGQVEIPELVAGPMLGVW